MEIKLPPTVAANIDHFAGRTWLLPPLLAWLGQSDARMFILTGGPGTGKSMVSAWLAGAGPVDQANRAQLEQFRAQVRATHFCVAGGGTAPKAFARDVATQLTASVAGFGDALSATLADLVQISPDVDTGPVAAGGSVTGVTIKHLDLGGLSDELSFDRAFREPLVRLYEGGGNETILLVVDALDEAATYTGTIDVVRLLAKLADLPRQVRILATTRPDPRVLKYYRGVPCLDLIEDAPPDEDDVGRYTHRRLEVDENPGRRDLADRIGEAAKGNFLYAYLILEDLLPRLSSVGDFATIALPERLSGIYHAFLNRELGVDEDRWYERFKPLLGLVAVAQGDGLSRAQIERIAGQDVEQTLRICKQYLDGDLPAGPFRPFHRSFAEFLLTDEKNEDYHIDAAGTHGQIASHYWSTCAGHWGNCDDYGLRYTVTHLAQAAQVSDRQKRHQQTERLVELVLNAGFQEAHQLRVGDLATLQHDLEQGLVSAAADADPSGLALVVEVALGLVAFRQERLRPELIFDLARAGDVGAAQRRLALFSLDPDWRQAALLTIAWLAAARNPSAARELRDHIASDLYTYDSLPLLVERVNVDLDGAPMPTLGLPPAPPSDVAREIVARMGGFTVQEGLLLEYGFEPLVEAIAASPDAEPVFVAERDSPPLVAYAAENPEEGTRYFEQYLSIHAANNYVRYRNLSLWVLLRMVLQHPDQAWVQKHLADLATAALTGSSVEFREGLPLAIVALQASAGKPGVDALLQDRTRQIQEAAHRLIQDQMVREQGDSWGSHKRSLAALAEAYTLLGDQAKADELLDQALDLPYGFAGFQSPACLTLAEAIRVCRPGDTDRINRALYSAQTAAHNVQDPTLCARTTARFNAMSQRWWGWSPSLFDVTATVERFCQDPRALDFTALHVVGEPYQYRLSGPNSMPLTLEMRDASALEVLARVYQRPLGEFLQLNEGWAAGDSLPPATAVNVPDPDFAPLLAARFAAEALADMALSTEGRVALIQSLAPVAVANPTALDAVLYRLMLAARPADLDVLDAPLEIAPPGEVGPPAGSRLLAPA